MHFDGAFALPGKPDKVIRQLADVERVARCVPGAQLDGRDDDGSYRGAVVVAFGPKRIKFHGKVFCDFDIDGHAGTLRGRGAADMRAARFAVITNFDVQEATGDTSVVRLNSEIDLSGVLAAVAGPGASVLGNALMQEFAHNLMVEFGAEAPSPVGDRPAPREIRLAGAFRAALRMLWALVWSKLFGETPESKGRVSGQGPR